MPAARQLLARVRGPFDASSLRCCFCCNTCHPNDRSEPPRAVLALPTQRMLTRSWQEWHVRYLQVAQMLCACTPLARSLPRSSSLPTFPRQVPVLRQFLRYVSYLPRWSVLSSNVPTVLNSSRSLSGLLSQLRFRPWLRAGRFPVDICTTSLVVRLNGFHPLSEGHV